MGSGNWIVDNLNSALSTWNGKLAEIWTLLSTSPQDFKGGGIWDVIVSINGGLKAVGYALLVLFFVMGVMKTCGSFAEVKSIREHIHIYNQIPSSTALATDRNRRSIGKCLFFSESQNAKYKIRFPCGLLGERSKPPALFCCRKAGEINHCPLKTE